MGHFRKHPRRLIPVTKWKHSAIMPSGKVAMNAKILTTVSLRSQCPAPTNQGDTSSCSGHATEESLYQRQVALGYIAQTSRPLSNDPSLFGSPLFNYYGARQLEGTTSEDDGANLDDNAAAAAIWGSAPYEFLPTSVEAVTVRPSDAAYDAGHKRQLLHSTRVAHDRYTLCSLLAQGKSIVLGIPLYNDSMSESAARTGIIPMPTADGELLGYHAVTVIECDPVLQTFGCLFHWFQDDDITPWGDEGVGHLPFAYIERMASSARTFDLIESFTAAPVAAA